MKSDSPKIFIVAVFLTAALAGFGRVIFDQFQDRRGSDKSERALPPVPVEVARIQHGPIVLQRTFSGELEALAEFVVAPKVSGRVERVFVNIADTVERGQVVAELDNAEYVQAVAQALADLEVARAKLSEARSALEIAGREFKRTESLLKRGIASDSEFDAACCRWLYASVRVPTPRRPWHAQLSWVLPDRRLITLVLIPAVYSLFHPEDKAILK